jgi:putative transposase
MRRNIARTTFGVGASRYANLMEGLVIDGIDQVWVTDITYFFIGGDCYYVVLVMDVYSRKLLGYSVEAHMRAESCLAALQMAFKARGRKDYGGSLIHHSDRGGQYASDLYTGALEVRGVRISMCLTVYENTHMERLNGTIKGEYLTPYAPTDLRDLKRKLAKAHGLYNDHRPHESLNFLAPTAFEESLASIPPAERTKLSLYVDPATKVRNKFRNQLTLFDA